MQTHRSFLSLCGRVAKQLLCESPTPSLMPRALTIVAILLQVLLKLVRRQTGVLIHPEVSQAFCRPLCVCVLHPFWIDKGLPVEPRLSTLFHLLWFSAVFTLGPPPSPRSVAPSNSGVLDWQKEQISPNTLRVLYHQRARDWWTPFWHTPPNSSMGGHGGVGGGTRVGLEVVQRGGEMVGLDRNWVQGLDLERR